MTSKTRCTRIGCHSCQLEKLREDIWAFRQALLQFIIEPAVHVRETKEKALSLKSTIDLWYEPHTEGFNENS